LSVVIGYLHHRPNKLCTYYIYVVDCRALSAVLYVQGRFYLYFRYYLPLILRCFKTLYLWTLLLSII